MQIIYIVLIFTALVGPALASFFSVIVMRMEGLSDAKGWVSLDDFSGKPLQWLEMIPVISFILLRGKSRYTGDKLDIRMWFAELLGLLCFGILSLGGFFTYSNSTGSNFEFLLSYIIILGFSVVLFFLAVYDLFTYSIPAEITKYLTFTVIGLNVVVGILKFIPFVKPYLAFLPYGTVDTLFAGTVAGAFVWGLIFITRQKGMGEGDVYIAVMMGLMLGGQRLLASFYITIFTATAIGIVLMIINRRFKGLIVPLVPFMVLGFIGAVFFGNVIIDYLFLGSAIL